MFNYLSCMFLLIMILILYLFFKFIIHAEVKKIKSYFKKEKEKINIMNNVKEQYESFNKNKDNYIDNCQSTDDFTMMLDNDVSLTTN